MLISFRHYRLSYAFSFVLSISILCALLMSGFLGKTGYSQTELTFAMMVIIGGVTYASVRDAAGALAYAVESSKFYRDEADFKLLKSYASGWRSPIVLLAKPMPSAMLMAAIFVGLQSLLTVWHTPVADPSLLATSFLTALLFPIAFSSLIYFLSPVLVGWKEVNARQILPVQTGDLSAIRRIQEIAAGDLLITMLINIALVLPVRHNPDFHPSLGYGSVEFVVAALILTMVVVSLSLLSSWRPRVYACSGDLYRSQGMKPVDPTSRASIGNRWWQWIRYSLLMCGFTTGTCILMGSLYAAAPIQVVLLLLLLPVMPIFWIERNAVLASNFGDATRLVAEHPPHRPMLESNELGKQQ